jgi:hypothetical protein
MEELMADAPNYTLQGDGNEEVGHVLNVHRLHWKELRN